MYYYLFHHFILDNSRVRCSGLSMGVPSCFAVVLQIPPLEKFTISLHWASMMWSRRLKCFFMSAEDWMEPGAKCASIANVTDDDVKKFYDEFHGRKL